jgi:peptidoglycan/LPS O-acetylase OafA/YrhL
MEARDVSYSKQGAKTASRSTGVSSGNLEALTGLRFPLALAVVGHHFSQPLPFAPLESLRAGAWLSVYAFFVLSGFVIAVVYAPERTPAKFPVVAFWSLRCARIYPLYLLALLAMLPFALMRDAPWTAARALGLLANVTMMQDWFSDLRLSWNAPAWSVSAEAAFYLAFPLVVPLLRRLDRRNSMLALSLAWLVHAALAVAAIRGQVSLSTVTETPLGQGLFFLCGALLGRLFHLDHESDRRPPGAALALVGGVGFLFAMSVASDTSVGLYARTLALPAAGLLVYGLAHGAGTGALALRWRAMRFLGEASYALYILQLPFALAWATLLHRSGVRQEGGDLVIFCAALVATTALAHVAIEKPIRRWVRARVDGASSR